MINLQLWVHTIQKHEKTHLLQFHKQWLPETDNIIIIHCMACSLSYCCIRVFINTAIICIISERIPDINVWASCIWSIRTDWLILCRLSCRTVFTRRRAHAINWFYLSWSNIPYWLTVQGIIWTFVSDAYMWHFRHSWRNTKFNVVHYNYSYNRLTIDLICKCHSGVNGYTVWSPFLCTAFPDYNGRHYHKSGYTRDN